MGIFLRLVAAHASLSKCLHCKGPFRPDSRNEGRQRFCSGPDCRKASKRHSQAQWLSKPANADYFQGSANTERVRQWRARHPGYWKRSGQPRTPRTADSGLPKTPDVPVAQPLNPNAGPVALQDACLAPLQDSSTSYHPVIVGLVALHLGSTLQEDIRPQLDLLAQNGLAILRHGAGGRPLVA